MNEFAKDVLAGLSAKPKYLQSKYFYDNAGGKLFQQIMHCPEYYLTRCEKEIFEQQSRNIAQHLIKHLPQFDIVELGAGDAYKSQHLLQALVDEGLDFTYFPIDISEGVNNTVAEDLPGKIKGLQVEAINDDFFKMIDQNRQVTSKPKVVLFLGSSIGNFSLADSFHFFKSLHHYLLPGDLLLTGFDLKKDPHTILAAYNDTTGLTKDFNLNLLHRINNELKGNFNAGAFLHYPVYDPETGACKSFLVSAIQQQVQVLDHTFSFQPYETIYMEISQKYNLEDISQMAASASFNSLHQFFDSRKWFTDVLWQRI